ncbi:polyprenyl synthetase [Streptomyces phaeoluteigriseus]|uniref:Polyprenyl synthetase n=1 Tax=Streptomyces phaeoluteigriseus TaxID=114686 RepID=A0A1V6MI13_9ACTN|nr:polyprenyl synthetase [Streptomyces phaeoluteigriseus]OQD51986.1 polyprenyl synthetase [Streptomyces phaeoluteigriseus]
MTYTTPRGPAREEQALLLAAGLADLAVRTVGSAFGTLRGLLRRSDTADLAQSARQELQARGRLALDRYANVPPAHLEVLARHKLAREKPDSGDV